MGCKSRSEQSMSRPQISIEDALVRNRANPMKICVSASDFDRPDSSISAYKSKEKTREKKQKFYRRATDELKSTLREWISQIKSCGHNGLFRNLSST